MRLEPKHIKRIRTTPHKIFLQPRHWAITQHWLFDGVQSCNQNPFKGNLKAFLRMMHFKLTKNWTSKLDNALVSGVLTALSNQIANPTV